MKAINLQSKKVLLIVGAVVSLSGIGVVSALTSSNPTSATEEPPIVKDVRRQGEVLDNHEARITNAENDVSDLQKNTGTAPSAAKVAVPSVSPPPATSTENNPEPVAPVAQPAPVVVTSYEKIYLGGDNIDCKFNYSDGTNYQWHWQTVNPQGSWVTDGQGQNGHWVQTTSHIGSCDQSTVGLQKN